MGFKFQTMDSRIQGVFKPIHVEGPAWTLRCYPGATYALEQAIESAPPGSVLVVDGASFRGAVLMGGLMSARARVRGLAGAVIDGCVRDLVELQAAGWPIFALGLTPAAGTHDKIGEQGVAVSCGGVVVNPGDRIVGDEDGVVVVPHQHWDAVLEKARAIEAKETFIAAQLEDGKSLGEAVALYRSS